MLDYRLLKAIAFDQAAAQRHVTVGDQQQAVGILSIAAGAADLLIVRLDRAGRSQVGNGAHVGAVNAHAKGVGGDDNLDSVFDKGALNGVPVWPLHARVIGGRSPAIPLEACGLFFGAFAGGGIDDGGTWPLVGRIEGFG